MESCSKQPELRVLHETVMLWEDAQKMVKALEKLSQIPRCLQKFKEKLLRMMRVMRAKKNKNKVWKNKSLRSKVLLNNPQQKRPTLKEKRMNLKRRVMAKRRVMERSRVQLLKKLQKSQQLKPYRQMNQLYPNQLLLKRLQKKLQQKMRSHQMRPPQENSQLQRRLQQLKRPLLLRNQHLRKLQKKNLLRHQSRYQSRHQQKPQPKHLLHDDL
jgi:hypothetical protein